MADPFSVTVGAIGLTATALSSIRALYDIISAIRDAPEAILRIRGELSLTQAVLESLKKEIEEGGLPDLLGSILKDVRVGAAVDQCSRACTAFNATLQEWMKHSTESKTSWRDIIKAYFGDAKIKAFTRQLSACKDTVNMAISTATLLDRCQQARMTKNMREVTLAKKEEDIQDARTDAKWQISELDQEERQLAVRSTVSTSQYPPSQQTSILEIQKDMGDVRKTLQAYVEICEAVKSKVHEARTGQVIKNIRTSTKGRAAVGMINMDGAELNIDQNIQDVSAESDGRAFVGVARNFNLDDFMK